jgi:hypothetical protein
MKSKRKRTLDKEIQMMAMGGDSGCRTAIKKELLSNGHIQ